MEQAGEHLTEPWLSVVMPTHNGERWIGRALASIAEADDRGIECILIDSSRTPETLQIAQAFAHRLTMRILRRPDMLPWTEKTNHGVQIAQAPHVCMLHQDDCWLPGRIPTVRRWLAAQQSDCVFVNPSLLIDAQDRVLGAWGCPLPSGRPIAEQEVLEHLLVQNFLAVPAVVFPREAYLHVGGMDPMLWYTADWDLYLKLAAVCGFYHCPETLTGFRIHGSSLTVDGSRDLEDFTAQLRTVLDRHAPRLQSSSRDSVLRAAETSIVVNVALAAAVHGKYARLLPAATDLLRLGPRGLRRYLRDSRLIDRLMPRLKAKFAGRLNSAPLRNPRMSASDATRPVIAGTQ